MHLTLRPFQTRFPFGSVPEELNLARYIRSPDHSTKGTISRFDALYVLVGAGFQVLFHSPPGVLFTFPSQYFSLSVTREYLGLEGGPPDFPRGFTCPAVLWILPAASLFRLRDSHALRSDFPFSSARVLQCFLQSVTPQRLLPVVWPLPRSLATTCGISVDFSSSPYLDVSVQAVPLIYLCIQYMMTGLYSCRIAPFRHLRINAYLRLPVTFRSLSRLSSAPGAKAFALCPS